jgi:hypothetical protein
VDEDQLTGYLNRARARLSLAVDVYELVAEARRLRAEMKRASSLGRNVLEWNRTHGRAVSRVDIEAIVQGLDAALTKSEEASK